MLSQLSFCDEAGWLPTISGTFVAPETKRAMDSVLVLPQGTSRVITRIAVFSVGWVNVLTWIWRKLEMV